MDRVTLVRVVAPHFVAGLVLSGDVCVRSAPILGWCTGRHRDELRTYFRKRGWAGTVLNNAVGDAESTKMVVDPGVGG